jgi:hypothetical protein
MGPYRKSRIRREPVIHSPLGECPRRPSRMGPRRRRGPNMGSRIRRAAMSALVLGPLLLTACVRFESFPRPQIVSLRPPFLLEDRLLTLREPVPGGWGTLQTVPVGRNLWARLDPDPSAPVLRYVASNLEIVSKLSSGFYDAGLHRAKYSLTVAVERGGPERQLKAEGTGRSGLSSPVAAYAAVEDAVTKLYQQLVTPP